MHEFRATTQNLGPAIIELDAAMRAGRLRHDGNPVLTWCIGNVVGKADRRGNLYRPRAASEERASDLWMAHQVAANMDRRKSLFGSLSSPIYS